MRQEGGRECKYTSRPSLDARFAVACVKQEQHPRVQAVGERKVVDGSSSSSVGERGRRRGEMILGSPIIKYLCTFLLSSSHKRVYTSVSLSIRSCFLQDSCPFLPPFDRVSLTRHTLDGKLAREQTVLAPLISRLNARANWCQQAKEEVEGRRERERTC